MTRTRLNLMAFTTTELSQLYYACASALESKSRGPHVTNRGTVYDSELCITIPSEAVKLEEAKRR